MPFSANGHSSFIDALFTSTSAVCVTGLIVKDTATHWTGAGQVIILLLLQIGGLGVMTYSALAVILMGGRISFRFRMILKEQLNQPSARSVVEIARSVVLVTLIIEGIGFVALAARWSLDFPFPQACWYALFHSVSAFCNAGFSVFSDSLMRWRHDVWINMFIPLLIILGGIGFTVLLELKDYRVTRRLSLHTRLALFMTVTLLAAGTVMIFLFETFKPPYSFRDYHVFGRLLTAFFQSATSRTAGFNTINIGGMSEASLFFIIILMFIGACPGGTGGGIKTTTFGAMAAFLVSIVRGRSDIMVFNRRLNQELVFRAFAIGLLSVGLIGLITLLMVAVEGRHLLQILFEVTSAFGTVGLSTGITPHLNDIEKILIIATMFIGRLGPLTIALALAQGSAKSRIRYPEEKLLIG